jgi:hypothetical protein
MSYWKFRHVLQYKFIDVSVVRTVPFIRAIIQCVYGFCMRHHFTWRLRTARGDCLEVVRVEPAARKTWYLDKLRSDVRETL